jgi:hypothetical protein
MLEKTMPVEEAFVRPRPVSWSAIIAGAAIALVAHFLLNLLGLGIGMSAMPAPAYVDDADAAAAGATALTWWSVSGIIAALLGGTVAGVLSRRAGFGNAIMHGLLAWTMGTLAIVAAIATGGAAAGATAGPLGAQIADYQSMRAEAGQPAVAGTRSAAAPGAAAPATEGAAIDPGLAQRAEAAADASATAALISLVALIVGALASILGARWANGKTTAIGATTRVFDMDPPRTAESEVGRDGLRTPPQTTGDGHRPYTDRH